MSSVLSKIANALGGTSESDTRSTSSDLNSRNSGEQNERTQFGDRDRSGSESNFGSSTTAADRDARSGSSLDSSFSSIPSPKKAPTSSSSSDFTCANSSGTDFGSNNSLSSNERMDRDYSSDDAMTRSEEQLTVSKEKVDVGKAELNKYVTTEKVSTAVPVMREKVVVEREPITEANRDAAMRGPDFKESHYEVNLTEERAVADKMAVPMERVRMRKEPVHSQQYVQADLRREDIEVIDPTKRGELGSGSEKEVDDDFAGSEKRSSDFGTNLSSDRTIAADDRTSNFNSTSTSGRRF
jgi:uncharacterized protein (TIGR02271 family)